METAIIAALVAGLVSVIGSFVNLRIAKQARDASLENSRLAASIRLSERRVKLLREQNRDAEKLRIAAWWLEISTQRSSRQDDPPFVPKHVAIERFQTAFREFFDNWADAKDAIPDEEASAVTRDIRHTCKNDALDVLDAIKAMASSDKDDDITKKTLSESLKRLREDLDDLFAIITDVQMAEMRAVLFGDQASTVTWFAPALQRLSKRQRRRIIEQNRASRKERAVGTHHRAAQLDEAVEAGQSDD